MSKVNSSDSIDWSWFDGLTITYNSEFIKNVVEDITGYTEQLNNNTEVIQETDKTITDLLYEIIGYDTNGNILSQTEWYNTWLTQKQINSYASSINFIIVKVKTNLTSETTNLIKQLNYLCEYILERHFSTPIPSGFPNAGNKPRIVNNTSPYYTKMTVTLYNFFYNIGSGVNGIGNDTILEMCANFTRDTISAYTNIKNWCGCFSPDSTFTANALREYPESASYTKACDPLCINPQSIKKVDSDGANSTCDSTLCILSNFNLSLSGTNGPINLNQNCPCANSGNPCFCIIDSSIESLLNKIQAPDGNSMAASVTFNQYCPGSQCYVEGADGSLTQVECLKGNPDKTGEYNSETRNFSTVTTTSVWFLISSIVLAFILFIQCARYIGFEPKYKIKGLIKPKVKLTKNSRSSDIGFLKKI